MLNLVSIVFGTTIFIHNMKEWPNQPVCSSSGTSNSYSNVVLLLDSQSFISLQRVYRTQMIFVYTVSGEKVTFDKIAEDEQHYWGYHGGRGQEVHVAGVMYKK